jgi:cytochrome c peroxidase
MKKLYLILILTGLVLVVSQSAFTDSEPKTAAELGRKLFFDPILSKTQNISCASCHKEEFAFADTSKRRAQYTLGHEYETAGGILLGREGKHAGAAGFDAH